MYLFSIRRTPLDEKQGIHNQNSRVRIVAGSGLNVGTAVAPRASFNNLSRYCFRSWAYRNSER